MGKTDSYYVAGVVTRFLAPHAETDVYCLVEGTFAPDAGPPPNRHPGEDEGFYVIGGTFTFTVDRKESVAKAGDWVKVPDGAVHTFRSAGNTPGRLIILNVPGAMHDRFFSEAGEPLAPGTRTLPEDPPEPDFERLRKAAEASGMELVEK